MLERFFRPKNEEEIERELFNVANKEFEFGVNGAAMYHAFNAVRAENKKNNYGFINNRLLNIVRDTALVNVSAIEDSMMGGREQVVNNINSEIEDLRQNLPEEERGA